MTKADLKKSLKALGCLSDENRMQIICFLQQREKCVCEIWRELNLPQNLISHHLKVLRESGLIKSRKDGLKVYYSLERQNLNNLWNTLGDLILK